MYASINKAAVLSVNLYPQTIICNFEIALIPLSLLAMGPNGNKIEPKWDHPDDLIPETELTLISNIVSACEQCAVCVNAVGRTAETVLEFLLRNFKEQSSCISKQSVCSSSSSCILI
ncbi:hypothetical protein T07_9223 [Trichinella nelsoni]|uniref:Uncharacterized protein n=1 Tax=Trichinella nelsoni TaxID=6336 RepID=A0A0V0RQ82_9BILA|nr:hypothetical protein T07_9223 [Trichinella nelsoni]